VKKCILILIAIVISTPYIYAEDKQTEWPLNRIGASASTFTGYGLTYYRHFADDFVVKLAVFGYGDSQDDPGYESNNLFATIGTELEYNLHKTQFTRLHVFGAFSLWYDESNYDYDYSYASSVIERQYVTGFGFGFEFLAWGIISFNIETGLQARFSVNSNNDGTTNKTTYPQYYGFGFGGGITYAF